MFTLVLLNPYLTFYENTVAPDQLAFDHDLALIFILSIGPDKDSFAPKIAFISLPINLNMCFGCSKELSH